MGSHTFIDYINAGFPAVMLITHEYDRAERIVQSSGPWETFAWDCIRGIRVAGQPGVLDEIINPVDAVKWIKGKRDSVLICHNLHLFLNDPELIQTIQVLMPQYKSTGICLIGISPTVSLRPELEKLFVVDDLPLPDEKELLGIQKDLGRSKIAPDRQAVCAAKGLTEWEAEGAFALSLYRTRNFQAKEISRIKEQLIRKSGVLECYPPVSMHELGGLATLKKYLAIRANAFQPDSTLPRLKAMLLAGVPGCGKSLVCKTVSSMFHWPLIRIDIGMLKGSLVGESEKRLREATRIIDAIGEAVIWIDEIEKQFAGVKSGGMLDGGVMSAIFSYWLTWMQETTAPVLIMATANDISGMPPEFLRAGRFDKIWFVDLPTLSEREEILHILNKRYRMDIAADYAARLDGFSGAEMEAFVKNACFNDVETALQEVSPLSRLMRTEIENLRQWASSRAQWANTPEQEAADHGRRIRKQFSEEENNESHFENRVGHQ
jgi:SpoVK/Ycf46/Vps4 family AAA+-type ATPase